MPLTAKSICSDTESFFRNQFITILVITFLCTLITITLNSLFLPNEIQVNNFSDTIRITDSIRLLEILKNISPKNQQILLRALMITSLSNLIGKVILVGSILLMTQITSSGQRVSAIKAISASIPILPKLFILIFSITTLVQIGIILIIIPGVLLSIVLAFAPVILVQDRISILAAIYASIKLSWYNMHLVAPAIIVWLLAKTMLLIFAKCLIFIIPNISVISMSILGNLVSAILLIYLFRLYMLIRK